MGCVFTPRPMIPAAPDGGEFTGAVGADGGVAAVDAGVVTPVADAGAAWTGDASADAPAPPTDDQCRPASDAGDAGYVNRDGDPCDPTATHVDAGPEHIGDASCDAAVDASVDAAVDASARGCDVAAQTGVARVRP
jgi:hypothetical protein